MLVSKNVNNDVTMTKATRDPGTRLSAQQYLFSSLLLICIILLFRLPRVAARREGRLLAVYNLIRLFFLVD